MWFFSSLLSAVLFAAGTIFFKMNVSRQGSLSVFLAGLYASGCAGFAVYVTIAHEWTLDWDVLAGACLVGVGSAAGNWLFSRSLNYGPISLTSPIVNLNIVYVVLMSVFFFAETLNTLEIISILLLFLSVCLLPIDPHDTLSISDRRWYLFVLLAGPVLALRNGGLKVTEEFGFSNALVLFYAYFGAGIWFFFQGIREFRHTRTRVPLKLGLIAGIFSFAGMQVYAFSLSIGPASLVAPVFSTNSLFVAIFSLLFLKERLSRFQTVALCLFFSGLFLLKMA